MAPRRIKPPSTSAVKPPPTCLLCGVQIPGTYPLQETPDQVLKKSHWRHLWRTKSKHAIVPAQEVEEAYFDEFPWLSSCFCRAFIKETDRTYPRYRLTGINIFGNSGCGWPQPCYAPSDPAKARVGGKGNFQYNGQILTQFRVAGIGRRQPEEYEGKVIGYLVHAHCWVLFNRVEDLTLNKANLATLVKVARKHWYHNDEWEIRQEDFRRLQRRLPNPKFDSRCDIYQSPLVIPAIRKAVEAAKIEGQQRPACSSKLPLEIIVMIAELVCPVDHTVNEVQDLTNMLRAFGSRLPDWFWRGRIHELSQGLFVELDELKSAGTAVDWQSLHLSLMGLVADRTWFFSSGLANRERVLEIMRALERSYLGQAQKA
ncbi:hypothetical protein BJY04DRAFT_14289 [Aspergillus karnatakaensis]|uniref:uncharacterized protein n=1 Tax=Aspergillus karnatakaensis TaxID=1810916 RepID=UPI003CCD0FC3